MKISEEQAARIWERYYANSERRATTFNKDLADAINKELAKDAQAVAGEWSEQDYRAADDAYTAWSSGGDDIDPAFYLGIKAALDAVRYRISDTAARDTIHRIADALGLVTRLGDVDYDQPVDSELIKKAAEMHRDLQTATELADKWTTSQQTSWTLDEARAVTTAFYFCDEDRNFTQEYADAQAPAMLVALNQAVPRVAAAPAPTSDQIVGNPNAHYVGGKWVIEAAPAPTGDVLTAEEREQVEALRSTVVIPGSTKARVIAVVDRLAPAPKPVEKTARELGEILKAYDLGTDCPAIVDELVRRAEKGEVAK